MNTFDTDLEKEVNVAHSSAESWLSSLCQCLGTTHREFLSEKLYKKMGQDMLFKRFSSSVENLISLFEVVDRMKEEKESLKTELLNSQKQIISLQSELLDSKTEIIENVQNSVTVSVQDTVKSEMRTYSDVVQAQKSASPIFEPESMKSVVRNIVQEEDRSRSLMMFGLIEEENEQLCVKVGEVLREIGEQPRIEACRLGAPSTGDAKKIRPIKINLRNSTVVQQILMKAKKLSKSTEFSKIYISPDRSPIERAAHRKLVTELKTLKIQEKDKNDGPKKKHYIRGGQIISVDVKN